MCQDRLASAFDAAKLDGAGWWQQMIYVTIPQMTTVIEFYIIVNMITMLSWVFSYVLVMTKGGPGNSTWVLEYFIYQKAFPYSQMQIASAAAVLLLVFTFILQYIGLLAERWFFFAQANHPQNLYYQAVS